MKANLDTSEPERAQFSLTTSYANTYSYAELADIYNQTRVDYIVPMPMNAKRMEEYIRRYDVDLSASLVALNKDGLPTGVAMLGLRDERAWITRLGVIPEQRRYKTGRFLSVRLLEEAKKRGARVAQLEVIIGNDPALNLFKSLGFEPTRELIVSRRPPSAPHTIAEYDSAELMPLSNEGIIALLGAHISDASWVEEPRSVLQSGGLRGFWMRIDGEPLGWAIYHHSVFQLEHIVLGGMAQTAPDVARGLLYLIQKQNPRHDTKVENIPAQSPLWPVFQNAGYIESFRRIEMSCKL